MSTSENFGTLFRANRKALGLTLREFCRRNGFDPGNVSRIEGSVVPPPQTRQLLESFAKALKLESGTVAWEQFFALAATEAGRIPTDVLEDQQASQKLPALFQRARGQGHSGWVMARDLEDWAKTLDARATLPQLVRRLIRATGNDIRMIEFPAHEQVQRPGWDGIVEAGQADAYVPAGTSHWEMGAGTSPQSKADDDFAKRMKDAHGLDRSKTTFVFVTPRKWLKKAEWRREKEALGVWKEVRVYDSASLEEWLEQSPAVDAWLAMLLNKKPQGVTSVEEYWANLQSMTDPSLQPEVFLASREEQSSELGRWLEGAPGSMLIEARSPDEAIDFVAAYSREPAARAEGFAAKALIVESREAWRNLAATAHAGLLLIAHPALTIEPELIAEAVRAGHRVLVSSSRAPRDQVVSLRLPRVYRDDLARALRSSNLDEERANRVAREAGGSLTVLKRLLGRYAGTTEPEWSRPPEAAALVPMLLAGGWDETSDGDRSAIERLSARPYSTVAEAAARWLKAPDSPLTRAGARWNLVSRDDSWFLLTRSVLPDDLRRFEKVALEVLADDDVAYELPAEERWRVRNHREVPKYSKALRTGLSETLALLAARPRGLTDAHDTSGRVEHIVRQLLEGQGRLRWNSLSDDLALLAEAAPEAFLEAVDCDLKRAKPALLELFAEEGIAGWPSNKHVGLLWALEGLAWDRALFPRVSLALAALDELTTTVKSGNSAHRSLLEIFMPWLPQTTAPVEERVRMLRRLAERWPMAGWRLLIELLPNGQQMSTPIYRPLWRDWALAWSAATPATDYWNQACASARLLVEQIGENVERWTAVIQQFEHLPGPVQKEFLKRLSGFAERHLDEQTRRAVSDTIREKVSVHRKFAGTNWALQGDTLAELESVRRRFEPEDAVRRNAWLFRPRWQLSETPEDEAERFDKLCPQALREILDEGGWQDVLRLVEAVEAPEEVGAVLATIGFAESERSILPELLVSAGERAARFAGGFVSRSFQGDGWDWVDRLKMDGWSAEEMAQLLVFLPFERKTWDCAAEKGDGVATVYWKHASPFTRGEVGDEAGYAVEMLLKHRRAPQAFIVLQLALHQRAILKPGLLMDALESWVESETGEGAHQGIRFQIHLLFRELQRCAEQKDPSVDLDRLAKLEWEYLGALDGHPASPVTLHGKLRDDPEFFVDVLGLVFRPKHQAAETGKEVSEKESQRAQSAYRLLRSWQEVPGKREGQSIDEKTLLDWIQKARVLAERRGLLEICDSRIGEVFAYDPEKGDDSWPCIPVRDALEEIGTDDIIGGFCAGIYNKRGLVSKSMREGGAQERALAEKYRKFADACKIEWPRTAAALRRVALGYEEDARREDARVKLDE